MSRLPLEERGMPAAPPIQPPLIYSHGNGHAQPSPTTHNTTLSAYHIKVDDLVDRLRASVKKMCPDNIYPYEEVHVLLLSWEDDDLGVLDEVVELEKVFLNDYEFHSVRRWEIPNLKPYSKLEDKLYRFRRDHSSSQNLLIVYYAGHGYLDNSRLWKWAAYQNVADKPPSPTLDWYALQSGLEHADSDVLILLDSCASAGSSGGSKQLETQEGGTTELLAACGFETGAPLPGPHSFTNALIKELRYMSTEEACFTVPMLHQRIVARLQHYSPEYSPEGLPSRWSASELPSELRTTPVHISLGSDFRQRSIPLRPFWNSSDDDGDYPISSAGSTDSYLADNTDWPYHHTKTAVKRLLGDNETPKVLLAINLQGEHWRDFENPLTNWLKVFPGPADSINIEAVFRGLSTMVLLSMPIAIWDLLPEHSGCSFVGFVQSPNLLPSLKKPLRSEQSDSFYEPIKDKHNRAALRNSITTPDLAFSL